MAISLSEPVVVVGDLNICRFAYPVTYHAMLLSFDGTDACDPGHQRSFDAASNLLAWRRQGASGLCQFLSFNEA